MQYFLQALKMFKAIKGHANRTCNEHWQGVKQFLPGQECDISFMVYEAPNYKNDCTNIKSYIGTVEGKFKPRYNNYLTNIKYRDKGPSTILSALM